MELAGRGLCAIRLAFWGEAWNGGERLGRDMRMARPSRTAVHQAIEKAGAELRFGTPVFRL